MKLLLRYSILDNLLSDCTDTEIDFILYLTRLQNELGQVRNLHYKFVCLELNICKASFYKTLYSLEYKGILHIDWTNNSNKYWNLQIIDNIFLNKSDFDKGYIKTNFFFLHERYFRELKLNIKIIILKLLKSYRPDQQFKIYKENLMKWINIKNKSVFEEYLAKVKEFFNITMDTKNMLIIKLKKYNLSYKDQNIFNQLCHRIKSWCGMYKVSYTSETLIDMYFIFVSQKTLFNKIINAMCETSLAYRSLEPALINSIIHK